MLSGKELSHLIGHEAEEYNSFYPVWKAFCFAGSPEELEYCSCNESKIEVGSPVLALVKGVKDEKIYRMFLISNIGKEEHYEIWNCEVFTKEGFRNIDIGREFCKTKSNNYKLFLRNHNLEEITKFTFWHDCPAKVIPVHELLKEEREIIEYKPKEIHPLKDIKKTEDSGDVYRGFYDEMLLKVGGYGDSEVLCEIGTYPQLRNKNAGGALELYDSSKIKNEYLKLFSIKNQNNNP